MTEITIKTTTQTFKFDKVKLMNTSLFFNDIFQNKQVDTFDFSYISEKTMEYFHNFVHNTFKAYQLEDLGDGIIFAKMIRADGMEAQLKAEVENKIFFNQYEKEGKISAEEVKDFDVLLILARHVPEMESYIRTLLKRKVLVDFIFEEGFIEHWKNSDDQEYKNYIQKKAEKFFYKNEEEKCLEHILAIVGKMEVDYDLEEVEDNLYHFCKDASSGKEMKKYMRKEETKKREKNKVFK